MNMAATAAALLLITTLPFGSATATYCPTCRGTHMPVHTCPFANMAAAGVPPVAPVHNVYPPATNPYAPSAPAASVHNVYTPAAPVPLPAGSSQSATDRMADTLMDETRETNHERRRNRIQDRTDNRDKTIAREKKDEKDAEEAKRQQQAQAQATSQALQVAMAQLQGPTGVFAQQLAQAGLPNPVAANFAAGAVPVGAPFAIPPATGQKPQPRPSSIICAKCNGVGKRPQGMWGTVSTCKDCNGMGWKG